MAKHIIYHFFRDSSIGFCFVMNYENYSEERNYKKIYDDTINR